MRTTINISDNVIKEAETLYETKNRSRAIENAIKACMKLRMACFIYDQYYFDT